MNEPDLPLALDTLVVKKSKPLAMSNSEFADPKLVTAVRSYVHGELDFLKRPYVGFTHRIRRVHSSQTSHLPGATKFVKPSISVIIPHLNQPRELQDCLESLANQTYPRQQVEIIVVDNGSSEPPTAITTMCLGVRLEHEPTPGPGPARNRGVEASRGDALAFIDADCIAHQNWLDSIVKRFRENKNSIILGGDVRIAIRDPQCITDLEAYESVFAYRQAEYIAKHGFSGTGNLAMSRDVFEKVGPFPGINVSEDRVWGRRAIARGYQVVYAEEMIVYHPARASFQELTSKWGRHIIHDFQERKQVGRSKSSWIARSLVVAASPLVDAYKVLISKSIAGPRARMLALSVLVRIRFWRSMYMLRLLARADSNEVDVSWNQP